MSFATSTCYSFFTVVLYYYYILYYIVLLRKDLLLLSTAAQTASTPVLTTRVSLPMQATSPISLAGK